MQAQKLTLYNVSWQALRVSLLGKWTSTAGTVANLRDLEVYLAQSPAAERLSRLWRVLNALNAVRMGNSGQGAANTERDVLVREFRDKVSVEYAVAKRAGTFVVDTPETIRAEWKMLSPFVRAAILDNLGRRQKLHKDSPHRPELAHFLSLVQS